MQKVFERIRGVLESKGIWHEVKEHEPVFTSEQAAQVRGVPLRMGVKAMVLKSGEGFILVLIRADKRVDLKLVEELEGKRVRLATAEEVLRVTGCEIGSVPPFGFLKPFKTYLDKEVLQEERVTFNAGLHTASVVMEGKDLLKVVSAVLF